MKLEKITHHAIRYRENNGSLSSFSFFLACRKVLRRPLHDPPLRDCTDRCRAPPS
jgi:hypothetical protein